MSYTNSNEKLLKDTLKSVSRSFYLSIRILPQEIRLPIGCAYLLARTADTITDTSIINPDRRMYYLSLLQKQLREINSDSFVINDNDKIKKNTSHPEYQLLETIPQQLELFLNLDQADQEYVYTVVITLIQAMIYDIKLFHTATTRSITAVRTSQELDQYLYQIAGCVGEFWTRVCRRHIPNLKSWNMVYQNDLGIKYGKALQMTNILRDVSQDLSNGRCYIPQDELCSYNLTPELLQNSAFKIKSIQLLENQVKTTLDNYDAAKKYVLSIPRRNLRLRLATLWPQLIGLETLKKMTHDPNWLEPNHATKVSRSWVYGMLAFSIIIAPSSYLTKLTLERMQQKIKCTLDTL